MADDFFNSKPEFGVEFDDLQNDPQQAFVEIRKAIKAGLMTPRGAVSSNRTMTATVLKKDINSDGDEYYHIHVHNVSANVQNPDSLLSGDAVVKANLNTDKLKEILIQHDHNSGPAYAYNPSKIVLTEGQLVYVETLDNTGTADGMKIISVAGTAPPSTPTAAGSVAKGSQTASSQSPNTTPAAKRKATVASQSKTKALNNLKKTNTGPCLKNSIHKGSPTPRNVNYGGEIIWFDYNCCKKEITTVQAVYQAKANNPSFKKISLWKDKKFEQTIKELLKKEIDNFKHPYAYGGKGQYSPTNIQTGYKYYKQPQILKKLRGKRYDEKYYDPNSNFYNYFFDCAGFVVWFSIRMGFYFAVRNIPDNSIAVKSYKNTIISNNIKRKKKGKKLRVYKKVNYNVAFTAFPQGYQSGYPKGSGVGIEISLEQFAATPGAIMAFRYSNNVFSHVGISQGTGSIRKTQVKVKGKMVDGVEVDVYEALTWRTGQKRTRKFYKKGKFYIEISNNRTMHFGLPLSFMLADHFGYWTGPNGENDPAKGKKKP